MSYRLPPLTTLRLFEAAARHMSFKQAADELALTPSAVSHGIQTLEDWLGVRLFVRFNRGLGLTEAGAAYLPSVRSALEGLAKATEALPGRRSGGTLTVSCASTLASRWLLPSLPRFNARHPHIQVTIDTRVRQVEFPRDGVDVGLRLAVGPWPDLYCLKLSDEHLVPVCAPDMAGRVGTVADLADLPLLRNDGVSTDWDFWFSAKGVDPVSPLSWSRFDTIHLVTKAAVRGMGVAIGRLPLIEADLLSGALVPVLGPPVLSTTAYWMVTAPESLSRLEVRAFRDWLKAELVDGRVR